MGAEKKYRVAAGLYTCDPDLPPEANLAAAIVRRAVYDARLLQKGRKPTMEDCYVYSETELRQFFRSRWFAILTGIADLPAERLLKEVGEG